MRALLLLPDSDLHTKDLLGMPIGTRALFAAIDAGASTIAVDRFDDAAVREWAADARVTQALTPRTCSTEEQLVLRADVLVAPLLLAELASGESIRDPHGMALAARVLLGEGRDPAQALAEAPASTWQPDRYRYATRLETAHDTRRAERALLAALVKPSDGPVSRHLNRPISTAITRRLLPLGVTPNQMTWVTASVALLAAALAVRGTWAAQACGAALFQLSSILDGCDGEIARLTRRQSLHGALFDSLVDDASNLVFFSGLAWGIARATHARWPIVAGACTAFGYLGVIVVQYVVVLRATGRGDKTVFWSASEPTRVHVMDVLQGLLRRNVFVALIMLAVLADCASWVVAVMPFAAIGALSASVWRALRPA